MGPAPLVSVLCLSLAAAFRPRPERAAHDHGSSLWAVADTEIRAVKVCLPCLRPAMASRRTSAFRRECE